MTKIFFFVSGALAVLAQFYFGVLAVLARVHQNGILTDDPIASTMRSSGSASSSG